MMVAGIAIGGIGCEAQQADNEGAVPPELTEPAPDGTEAEMMEPGGQADPYGSSTAPADPTSPAEDGLPQESPPADPGFSNHSFPSDPPADSNP